MTKDTIMEIKWRNAVPPELQKKDKKHGNFVDKNKPDENDKYNFIYDHRAFIYQLFVPFQENGQAMGMHVVKEDY